MEKNVTGLDELFAGYAAGTLAAPAHALVGAHLELSGRNRKYVATLEDMGGLALEQTSPISLSDRDAALAAILDSDAPIVKPAQETAYDKRLPRSLSGIVGNSLETLPWKTLLPGVKECKFDEIDGCVPSVIWVRGGRAMPSHTHEGTELTLVLQGGFKDEEGHFVRGDLAFADDHIDHKPVADEGEDCICFAVTEGSLRLTGPIGRWFAPFVRG